VRCSEINAETEFCLQEWGFEVPLPVEEVITPDSKVCLVDFQQTTQLNSVINADQVVGVIDHHALQNSTIVSNLPIYVDIRPWGSMCTIIAHNYLVMNKPLPKNLAGLLLSAILSDTLNLKSPTSTDMDMMMAGILAKLAEVPDINQYCKKQFKAKSGDPSSMSDNALIEGDLKKFSVADVKVGFGTYETASPEELYPRIPDLVKEIQYVKQERDFDVCFFSIVDIVNMCSKMLIVGPREAKLGGATFEGCPVDGAVMDTGDRVSRKKQFIPPLTAVLKAGFEMPAEEELNLPPTVLTMGENSNGDITRTASS